MWYKSPHPVFPYCYWPSYSVCRVFPPATSPFFLWWLLIFNNVLCSSLVLHFPLIPHPVSKSYLISCSFRLYPLVAVFWVLLSLLFFFPAHFSRPCLISLIPPKWPISGSEVPHPNMLLEPDLSLYWSTEKQLVLKKSNWGLTSEGAFEWSWSSRSRRDTLKFLEITRDPNV